MCYNIRKDAGVVIWDRIIKHKERKERPMYERSDSFSRRVELRTTGYVVAGKWVSAIILIIRANFPRLQDPNPEMLRRAL